MPAIAYGLHGHDEPRRFGLKAGQPRSACSNHTIRIGGFVQIVDHRQSNPRTVTFAPVAITLNTIIDGHALVHWKFHATSGDAFARGADGHRFRTFGGRRAFSRGSGVRLRRTSRSENERHDARSGPQNSPEP